MLSLRVHTITTAAEGIKTFELRIADGLILPDFSPGAHLDVGMANGLVRQYSLINDSAANGYVIGVNKDPASRGGSLFMHGEVRIGDVLQCSEPRNNFPLDESATHSLFIAGGIGITPILSMVRRLVVLGRPWHLYHCTRTSARTPFVAELEQLAAESPGKVDYVHDGEPGGKSLNVNAAVASAPSGAHFYCCGPTPLMNAFIEATKSVSFDRVHTEYFSIRSPQAERRAFEVVLAKSNRTITVPSDLSILQALEQAGLSPLCSCREGVCGTCETRIIAGEPEHHDVILTPAERESNETMMICVSRARGNVLTLDL